MYGRIFFPEEDSYPGMGGNLQIVKSETAPPVKRPCLNEKEMWLLPRENWPEGVRL